MAATVAAGSISARSSDRPPFDLPSISAVPLVRTLLARPLKRKLSNTVNDTSIHTASWRRVTYSQTLRSPSTFRAIKQSPQEVISNHRLLLTAALYATTSIPISKTSDLSPLSVPLFCSSRAKVY